MIPLASVSARTLGKRMNKVATEAQEKTGFLTTYLVELFKNHKLTKIFQKEKFEMDRAENHLHQVKEKTKKIALVMVRLTPIMEILTGIMIAILIFYSGKLILKSEIDVNNFFILGCHDVSLSACKNTCFIECNYNQGLSAANGILPIIDTNKIFSLPDSNDIKISDAKINFDNVKFAYETQEGDVFKGINLEFKGGKMTSLVGHSGLENQQY